MVLAQHLHRIHIAERIRLRINEDQIPVVSHQLKLDPDLGPEHRIRPVDSLHHRGQGTFHGSSMEGSVFPRASKRQTQHTALNHRIRQGGGQR